MGDQTPDGVRTVVAIDGSVAAAPEIDGGRTCVHLVPDGDAPASTLQARSTDGVVRLHCIWCHYSRDLPPIAESNPHGSWILDRFLNG